MTYRVIYGPTFRDHLREHVQYLHDNHVSQAVMDAWYNRLFDLVDGLDEWPNRFPVDEEQSNLAGRETRKLNVGKYLVFYQVDDEAKQVHLVGFRHGARRRKT